MTQPPAIGQRHRRSPSGPFLPPDDVGGCVLQTLTDWERSDVLRLGMVGGQWLLPREQGNAANPLRCEFSTWTPGSFLRVAAACAFILRQDGGGTTTLNGSHRIAIDIGAGWQAATRTGRVLGATNVMGMAQPVRNPIANVPHDHLLGPFDVAPKVAIVASWSLSQGAWMETGPAAASFIFSPLPAGLSLVCSEVRADCVAVGQPPELVNVTIVPPNFVPAP